MRRCLILALTCIAPAAAAGQVRDTTVIPRDFFDAISLLSFRPTPLLLGQPPADFPQELIPSGVLLGSQGRMLYVRLDKTPGEALLDFRQRLERIGWRLPPEQPSAPLGGFVSSRVRTGATGEPTQFCSGSMVLQVRTIARPGGGSYMELARSEDFGFSPCSAKPAASSEDSRNSDVPVPNLVLPEGVRGSVGYGVGGGNRAREATAEFEHDMSPAELADFFAKQLTTQGWTLGAPISNGDLASTTATKADSPGRELYAILLVTRSQRRYELSLRVSRRRSGGG